MCNTDVDDDFYVDVDVVSVSDDNDNNFIYDRNYRLLDRPINEADDDI